MNQVDGNDPRTEQKTKTSFKIALKQIWLQELWCALILDRENRVTHSGISPKASADWAAVLYALMYSLAVFWTWHSCTKNVFYKCFSGNFGYICHFFLEVSLEKQQLRLMMSDWCFYLDSQIEVLLNELFAGLGPVADAVVYFEHAGFPCENPGCPARVQPGPESPPMHSLPKVDLFCDDAHRMVLSKVLLRQEILLEHQPGTLDILFFSFYLYGGS